MFTRFIQHLPITISIIILAAGQVHAQTVLGRNALKERSALKGIHEPKSKQSTWLSLSIEAQRAIENDDPDRAEKLFTQALKEAQRPEQSIYRTVDSLRNLALLHQSQRKDKEAELELRKAISILRKLPPGPLLAACLESLGEVFASEKKFDKADELFQRSLAIRQGSPIEWRILASHMLNYGCFCEDMKDYHRAEKQYKKTLAYIRTFQKDLCYHETTCLGYLINLYAKNRELSKANALAAEVLNHPYAANGLRTEFLFKAIMNVNTQLCLAQQWPAAEQQLTKCIKIFRSGIPGCETPLFQAEYILASQCYEPQKRYEQAQAVYEKILPLAFTAQESIDCLLGLGRVSLSNNRLDTAESAYKKALGLCLTSKNVSTTDAATACYNLGLIYQRTNRPDQAQKSLRQALSIYRRQAKTNSSPVINTLLNLGQCNLSTNNCPQAEKDLKEALKLLEAEGKSPSPEYGIAAFSLGITQQRQHKYKEAELYLQKSLPMAIKMYGADHASIGDVLVNLGICQEANGKLKEAATSMEKALSIYQARIGKNAPELCNILLPYARVLKKMRRDREAEHYEQTAKTIMSRQKSRT